ncbi:hypothetical protein PHYBOEH_006028 [Phytophthora boehmeriae]|uniref:Uncharacterized protein n=1 Tax=Phytophthora boehmeriae TaxID=109152 RepID=A0A8T1WJM7_9STRA|nr:hypothetical protein PHYBOEH_006028 [Phytophthora boehmeriae]
MGAKSSKPPPRQIEPDDTAVEIFHDDPPRDSGKNQQKTVVQAHGGTVQEVREKPHEASTGTPSETQAVADTQDANGEKSKKKRRRSKKDKSKPPSPKLVRAQTQLNELKNVKPLLQQNPQVRQQHFEQIQDAYALDEDAKKAPDSRVFSFGNWKRAPPTPSGKVAADGTPVTDSSPPPQRPQMPRAFVPEIPSNSVNDSRVMALMDVEAFSPVTVIEKASPSNQLNHSRMGTTSTQATYIKTRGRTPDRSQQLQSQRSRKSELRLDDVDEDLMEHILTKNVP